MRQAARACLRIFHVKTMTAVNLIGSRRVLHHESRQERSWEPSMQHMETKGLLPWVFRDSPYPYLNELLISIVT
jgi:hypothetical protein